MEASRPAAAFGCYGLFLSYREWASIQEGDVLHRFGLSLRLSRSDHPHRSAVLTRYQVEIGLAENGGDPTQDGCAFHVTGLAALLAEFKANGLPKELSDVAIFRAQSEPCPPNAFNLAS